MLSELFCVSSNGETIFYKKYRFDINRDTSEIFIKKLLECGAEELLPNWKDDDISYYHIKRNDLHFVATSKSATSPIIVIEILTRLHHLFKDFCGTVNEDSLKINIILIYEILDEFMDNGYVQLSTTDKIKPYIQSDPVLLRTAKTHDNMKSGPEQRKNEIFVDVVERITALIDKNGDLSRCNISGKVNMKCFLPIGSPIINLALNEDLVIMAKDQEQTGYGSSVQLSTWSLHPSVDASNFSATRELKIHPPEGEVTIIEYSQQDNIHLNAPFRLSSNIEDTANKNSKESVASMKLRCSIPESAEAVNVTVKIPLPKNTESVFTLMKDTNHKLEFVQVEKYVHWTMKKLRGGEEAIAKFRITTSRSTSSARLELGPLALNFELSGHVTSGFHIRYLRVSSKDQDCVPHRWIRYITVPDSYIIRL